LRTMTAQDEEMALKGMRVYLATTALPHMEAFIHPV
jgi:hypothetical protein